jgi:hypothetical protein
MRGTVPSDLDAIGALVRRSMAHPWTLDQLASALASPGSRVQLVLSEPPDARDASPIAFAFARRVTDLLEIDLWSESSLTTAVRGSPARFSGT